MKPQLFLASDKHSESSAPYLEQSLSRSVQVIFPIMFEGHHLQEPVYIHTPSKTAIIIDLLVWMDLDHLKGIMLRNVVYFLSITLTGNGCMPDIYKPSLRAGKKEGCN